MSPEQRTRLWALLPEIRAQARYRHPMNEVHKQRRMANDLEQTLIGSPGPDAWTPEQWLAYAERAAKPPAEKIIRAMTMDQIRSGHPPEHFAEGT